MRSYESEAREMRDEGYECSCHLSPPCSFCESMNEQEADARWNGGVEGLEAFWAEQDEKMMEEE